MALPALGASLGCASPAPTERPFSAVPRVIVIGGGVAGATAAVALKREAGEGLEVVLIERESRYTSAPLSNAVIGGWRRLDELSQPYDGLRRLGIRVLHDEVVALDPATAQVRLREGATMRADRLIGACGIEPVSDRIDGLDASVQSLVLHAWQQTRQVEALRQRLIRLPDDATVLMSIPRGAYSGQMAPYERACQIASWLRYSRPRSRLIVLDANPSMPVAAEEFHRVFRQRFAGLLDYRPNSVVTEVGPEARHVILEGGERVRADLSNVIPPARACALIREAGLAGVDGRWSEVTWPTMASAAWPKVHVIGDAVASPPGMAKSASVAAAQARWAVRAILEALQLRRVDDPPSGPGAIVTQQYAFVDGRSAVQAISVHRLGGSRGQWTVDAETPRGHLTDGEQALQPGVRGPGDPQGVAALAFTRQLWKDMLET